MNAFFFVIQVRVLRVQRLCLHPVTVDLRHQWSGAAALNLGRVESLVESYFLVASTAVSPHAMLVTVYHALKRVYRAVCVVK